MNRKLIELPLVCSLCINHVLLLLEIIVVTAAFTSLYNHIFTTNYIVCFNECNVVQLVAQKGDLSQALDLMIAARSREGKDFTLPSSEITQDLIRRIKQRQTKTGKGLNEVADKEKISKRVVEDIKNGQFT